MLTVFFSAVNFAKFSSILIIVNISHKSLKGLVENNVADAINVSKRRVK